MTQFHIDDFDEPVRIDSLEAFRQYWRHKGRYDLTENFDRHWSDIADRNARGVTPWACTCPFHRDIYERTSLLVEDSPLELKRKRAERADDV